MQCAGLASLAPATLSIAFASRPRLDAEHSVRLKPSTKPVVSRSNEGRGLWTNHVRTVLPISSDIRASCDAGAVITSKAAVISRRIRPTLKALRQSKLRGQSRRLLVSPPAIESSLSSRREALELDSELVAQERPKLLALWSHPKAHSVSARELLCRIDIARHAQRVEVKEE